MTNKERFIELLRSTKREGIEKLIDFLEKTDFFTAPASTRFHMSCEGGLLQHSLNVYDCLASLGTTTGDVQEFQAAGMRLDSIPQESIIIVALLHDLCKVNFYATEMRWRKDANNKWEQYPVYAVNDRNPYGHGEKSVMMASEFIHLTMEERYAIRWHMGMSEANIGKGNVRVPKDHETGKRNDRGSGTVYGSYRDIGFLCGRRHCRFRL